MIMRSNLFSLAFLFVFLALPLAFGQEPVPAPGDGVPEVTEVVKEAVEVGKVIVEGKPEGIPTVVWIGMLMALIGNFALTLLRKWGMLLGKQTMRLAWLGVGVVVAVGTKMGMGMDWWEAAYLGMSTGPGSAITHEVLKLFSPAKWAKDKAAEA